MDNSFAKIFSVAKRLGLPAIVMIGDEPVVIMEVSAYERLQNPAREIAGETMSAPLPIKSDLKHLSEEDLFDKINRDIAAWRSAHQETEVEKTMADEPRIEPVVAPLPLEKGFAQSPVARDEDDEFYIEPIA